jgi:V-type H+-transporting ATPase subunit a
MLWRACRGNVFLRQAEIEDPLEDPQAGDQVFKSVFVIFFQGDLKPPVLGLRNHIYPLNHSFHDKIA